MSKAAHDDLTLEIALIKKGSGRGRAKTKKITWGDLKDRLDNPKEDKKYSLEEYRDLSTDRQARLKDIGSFVGGPFLEGRRKSRNMLYRTVLTLDIDEATPRQIEDLKLGLPEICQYEFFGHTTRKHDSDAPRWRLLFPLAKPLKPEDYTAASRIAASKIADDLQDAMDAVDDVSFRVAQVMYWPSICKDAEFEIIENSGNLLDAEKLLDDWGYDGDWAALPFSERRGRKRPTYGNKAEDPTQKKGIVGAFCRAYDVEEAIAEFLPEIYSPGDDDHSEKPRYNYLPGSGANGAVVEDDGLFLYSHHGTDPCGERLVNAFDLVRIHLFGDLDEDSDEDETNPGAMPSFKAMAEFAEEDPRVGKQISRERQAVIEAFDIIETEDDEDPEEEPREARARDLIADLTFVQHTRLTAPECPVELLGPTWAHYVRQWAANAAAPVDFVLAALLATAGGCIGNARHVSPKPGWKEPPVIWAQVIGPPSSRKSPAVDPIVDIAIELDRVRASGHGDRIKQWEQQKAIITARRKDWEAKVKAAIEAGENPPPGIEEEPPPRPTPPRLCVTDATIEAMLHVHSNNPKGLILKKDELAGWYLNLSRYSGGSDRPIWIEAYGGRHYSIDRVKHDGVPVTINHFSVSIIGPLQPDRVQEIVDSPEDGLLSRFLFFWPEHKPRKMNLGVEIDNGPALALEQLAKLEMDDDRPVTVPFTKKALKVFTEWADNQEENDGAALGHLLAAFGKALGHVARLALIFEYLDWAIDAFSDTGPPTQVNANAVKRAIEFRERYIVPMQRRVMSLPRMDETTKNAKSLANFIVDEKPESVNVTQIRRSRMMAGVTDSKKVEEAISLLCDAGWLIPVKVKDKSKGRPKKDFRVNPEIHEHFARRKADADLIG